MELISGIRYTDKPFFFFLVQAIKEPLKKSAFEERNIYSIVFYRLIKGSYVWPKHYWHSPVFSYRSDSTANNKVPRTVSFDIYLSKQSSWNQEGSNSTGIFFFFLQSINLLYNFVGSLKCRFMFCQTLVLNEYCINLILDQRENLLCIKQEKHFPILKSLLINTLTFT